MRPSPLPPRVGEVSQGLRSKPRDNGGAKLKARRLQTLTPIDAPAKTLSGHVPHEWGTLGRSNRLRSGGLETTAVRTLGALAVIAAFACASALAAEPLGRVEIGASAPGFTAQGADGLQHSLGDYAGKVVVLEWTSPVCPYTAIKYRRGLMQALQRRAARQGVVWIAIDTAAPDRPGYLTPEAARARITSTRAQVTAFLSDPDGRIGRAYGARTTPTLYVIAADGRLAYQGAVDSDPQASRPDQPNPVAAALDDLRAGRPVRVAETRAYGCAVEY